MTRSSANLHNYPFTAFVRAHGCGAPVAALKKCQGDAHRQPRGAGTTIGLQAVLRRSKMNLYPGGYRRSTRRKVLSMMGGAGGMGWGFIWPVILLMGLGALTWGLTRASRSSSGQAPGLTPPPTAGQPPQRDRAQEILRERYARGEISEEEFHTRMRALGER